MDTVVLVETERQIEVELHRGDRRRHVWVDDQPTLAPGVRLRLQGEDELWTVAVILGSRTVPVIEGTAS